MLVASIALLWIFSLGGNLNFWEGIIVLLIFGLFIFENLRSAKKHELKPLPTSEGAAEFSADAQNVFAETKVGADGGEASSAGGGAAGVKRDKRTITVNVPESIIAVTMVAIGTSLPELVTTITAIAKKQASLSVGNIIGANIIDLTLILPVCSFISGRSGLDINAQTVFLDMPVCLGFVLISVVPSMITGKFARWQGITLLALYIGYIVVLSTGVLGF